MARTNERIRWHTSTKWGCSLSSVPYVLSIDRQTRRYLVLPRPIIIAHIEPDDVPAKVRLSTFVPVRQSCPCLSRSFSFSHAALAGGRRRRKLRNEAPKLPKWPCAMQARRSDRSSGLCACLVTVTDCYLVGMMQEDAQAPRTRSCDVRAARNNLRNKCGDPWNSGAAGFYRPGHAKILLS